MIIDSEDKSRPATIDDARPMPQHQAAAPLEEPAEIVHRHVAELSEGWTHLSHLRARGCSYDVLEEAVERGLAEGLRGPTRFVRGRWLGVQFWFRLPG